MKRADIMQKVIFFSLKKQKGRDPNSETFENWTFQYGVLTLEHKSWNGVKSPTPDP